MSFLEDWCEVGGGRRIETEKRLIDDVYRRKEAKFSIEVRRGEDKVLIEGEMELLREIGTYYPRGLQRG